MRLLEKTKDFTVYFIFNVLQRGLSLLLLPFYTAYLSVSEYGIICIAASFQVVTTIFYFSLPDAVYFKAMRNDHDEAGYNSAALRIIITACCTCGGGLICVALLAGDSTFIGVKVYPDLVLILASTLFIGIFDVRLQYLQAKQRAYSFCLLGISKIGLQTITVLIVLYFAPSVTNVLAGQFFVNVILVTLIVSWLFKSIKVSAKGQYHKTLSFGLPLVLHSLAHWGRSNLDKVMLAHYAGTDAVGVFGIVASIASVVNIITEAYRNFHNPLQFKWLRTTIKDGQSLRFYSYGFVVLMVIVSIAVVMVSPLIYALVIKNNEYFGGPLILPLLLGSSVAFAIYITVVNWVFFNEGSNIVAAHTVTSSILMIPVSLLLISWFGVEGAAVSQFLGSFLMSAVICLRIRRYKDFPVGVGRLLALALIPPALGLVSLFTLNQRYFLLPLLFACGFLLVAEYSTWKKLVLQ